MSAANVLATYLASTDSRDKLIKGFGCLFKLIGATGGDARYLKGGAALSDCRCLMRLGSWLCNVQKLSDALQKRTVHPRDVIFILRVILDGIFSLLDNVVYIGQFFVTKSPQLGNFSYISRAALFYGYVAAVALDIIDLRTDVTMKNRRARYFVLLRNTCDMVSAIGNVSSINIGAANAAALGLISAIIASSELLSAASISVSGKKAN